MPPTPPSTTSERRVLALRIKLLLDTLDATGRRPPPHVAERLAKALGLISAGDLREALQAILEAERTSRFVLGRRSVVSASPEFMARVRERLEAVLQDIGI